jgi:hypothetical protein
MYIVFIIWNHGQEELKKFIEDLNTAHPTIKFTANWSYECIPFLDTLVILKDGTLFTDLYTKNTDTHQYLSAGSCHPHHCKAAIPYSQALRIRRICSFDTDFRKHTDQLCLHLTNRGYNHSFVRQQIDRARMLRREDLLTPQFRSNSSTRVPLVITYHPNLPNLPAITGAYLPLLHISPRLQQAIPEKPVIAYN